MRPYNMSALIKLDEKFCGSFTIAFTEAIIRGQLKGRETLPLRC